jgi:TatD DNase family protein
VIDIGLNLTNGQFARDHWDVLRRAVDAGVTHCVLTGTDLESSRKALELCLAHADELPLSLSCTAGIHPHDADHFDTSSSQELVDLLSSSEYGSKIVACGETGLDFNRNYSTKENQIRAFEAQIEIAISHKKPLFLHERDAFDTQSAILRERLTQLPETVIHCFTGNREQLLAYIDMGFYIGITGWICDPKRGIGLQEIVGLIPENRLLIETDAPFLLPKNIQPKPDSRRNEPAYLPWIAKKIAECSGASLQSVIASTSANAKRFFQLS